MSPLEELSERISMVEELAWTSDRDEIVARLRDAVDDVQRAIDQMQGAEVGTHHYGG